MLQFLGHLVYVLAASLIGATTLVILVTAYTALRYRVHVTARWDVRSVAVLGFILGLLMGLSEPLWVVPILICATAGAVWVLNFAEHLKHPHQRKP